MSTRGWVSGRRSAAGATAILLGILTFGGSTANAAHSAAAAGGPYDGFSTGSVLHLDALSTTGTRVVNADVGVVQAAVDSEGLEKILSEHSRPVVPGGKGADHARAHSTVLEAGTFIAPDAENQLKPYVADVYAPNSASEDRTVLDQTISTALHAQWIQTKAAADWNGTTCVIGEPIAQGSQLLGRLEMLDTSGKPEADGYRGSTVGLDAERAGPARATSSVISKQQLFFADDDRLGLLSTTATTLAPVTFFEGTEREFTLEFDGPAILSALADGGAGGASVRYSSPLVSLIQRGQAQTLAPGSPTVVRVPTTGDAIAEVKIGVMEPIPAPKGPGGTATTKSDGTLAAAQAHVVEVALLDLQTQQLRGATVALGHMEARSKVPAGGITCPIPVSKVAEPSAVTVGDRFDTTITVRNPFACPITDVRLTDDITVEDAARFEIVETAPDANVSTDGSALRSGTVIWNNLGTIEPGKSKSVVVSLTAQGGVGRILDTASASGTLENCLAGPGSADAAVFDLTKATVDVTGTARLEVATAQVLGEMIARTGNDPRETIGIGIALIMIGLWMQGVVRARRA